MSNIPKSWDIYQPLVTCPNQILVKLWWFFLVQIAFFRDGNFACGWHHRATMPWIGKETRKKKALPVEAQAFKTSKYAVERVTRRKGDSNLGWSVAGSISKENWQGNSGFEHGFIWSYIYDLILKSGKISPESTLGLEGQPWNQMFTAPMLGFQMSASCVIQNPKNSREWPSWPSPYGFKPSMVWLLARQRLAGSFSQQGGQVKQDADVLNRLQAVVMVRGWRNNLKWCPFQKWFRSIEPCLRFGDRDISVQFQKKKHKNIFHHFHLARCRMPTSWPGRWIFPSCPWYGHPATTSLAPYPGPGRNEVPRSGQNGRKIGRTISKQGNRSRNRSKKNNQYK